MMRKLCLVLIAAIGVIPFAQSQTYESESFGSETVYYQNNPKVRRLTGATKINVKYTGNWTGKDHIKGAFEYACRIWEERLLSAYPILIDVKFRPMSNTTLASTAIDASILHSDNFGI